MRFLPPAEIELLEAVDYYERQRSGMGRRLLATVERITEKIAKLPVLGRRVTGGYRRFAASDFPFVLVYQERDTECLIVALTHTSRRPGYWRDRMK